MINYYNVAEIILNGQYGMIVEPEDIGALAKTMQGAYNLPSDTLEMIGLRSREYALKELSKEVNLSKLVLII